jgi:DNA-binding transcriptional LysR family regulator
MAFTLRQLQFFVAAAEAASVSGAARALSISQSSVTEAIQSLEEDLGVSLFERRARGLDLTHKGSLFLRHATQILSDVSNARMAFTEDAAEGEGATGRLSLGVTSLVAGYVLSDILSRFRRAFPQAEVNALEDSGEYLQHLLIGGELDVAVMLSSSVRDRAALNVETLLVSPYRLWLPMGHPLTDAEAITLDALAGEQLILLTVDEIEDATRRLMSAMKVKPNVAFRTRSVEAVRSLVATGAGVALLPDLVYRPWSLEGDRIESRDVSGSLPVVQVGMVWRRGSSLPQAARDFIGIAQSQRTVRQRP